MNKRILSSVLALSIVLGGSGVASGMQAANGASDAIVETKNIGENSSKAVLFADGCVAACGSSLAYMTYQKKCVINKLAEYCKSDSYNFQKLKAIAAKILEFNNYIENSDAIITDEHNVLSEIFNDENQKLINDYKNLLESKGAFYSVKEILTNECNVSEKLLNVAISAFKFYNQCMDMYNSDKLKVSKFKILRCLCYRCLHDRGLRSENDLDRLNGTIPRVY